VLELLAGAAGAGFVAPDLAPARRIVGDGPGLRCAGRTRRRRRGRAGADRLELALRRGGRRFAVRDLDQRLTRGRGLVRYKMDLVIF
jgi:hypothetical protein